MDLRNAIEISACNKTPFALFYWVYLQNTHSRKENCCFGLCQFAFDHFLDEHPKFMGFIADTNVSLFYNNHKNNYFGVATVKTFKPEK